MKLSKSIGIVAMVIASVTAGSALGGNKFVNPKGWDKHVRMKPLRDVNPDPDIVEVYLEAKEAKVRFTSGEKTKVYTYNGVIPGPLIEAKKGDTLIVHFTNNLPEPTTIHWHGVELPADMDGSIVSQNPIPPGGTFRYEFPLNDASLFWYHPHVRSNEQVEKGLAGALLVRDDEYDRELGLPQDELVMVLDDILLNENGQVEEFFAGTPEEILLEKINGREGNTLLVNGHELPTIKVRSGIPLRLRLVNISNTRFFNVAIPGHKLTRIGGDGGLLETPLYDLDSVLLVPGERADVVFTPIGHRGEELFVQWHDVERGRHSITIADGKVMMGDDPMDGQYPPISIMRIKIRGGGDPFAQEYVAPAFLRTIEPIDVSGASIQTLKFGHTMPMPNGDISFTINGKRYDQVTLDDAPDAFVGETQVWNLVNMTGGDHPFHLHGFFFQVLEVIYKDEFGNVIGHEPAPYLELKDTVNLVRRPGPKGSVSVTKIAVKFDPKERSVEDVIAYGGPDARVNADLDNGVRGVSGGWQFHCHILEHADSGMMSYFELKAR